MNKLPQGTGETMSQSNMAIIKQKMPEKKHMVIGIILCLVIGITLYLVTRSIDSESAELTRAGEEIYSPTDGIVYEILVPKGQKVRKGDAILRFDPMYIRTKTMEIRSYLQAFKENMHNPGTLRQIFKPLLKDVFSGISGEVTALSEQEAKKLGELQKVSREHAKIQVQVRSPKNQINGAPDPELVKKEKELAKQVQKLEEELEVASVIRANADKKYRDMTASLAQPNSILYRYLEEEYNKALQRQKHEYIYAPFNAIAGETSVHKGSIVQKDDLLMELHPANAQEWWVRAVYSLDNAKKLKDREVCTVVTEDGLKLEARIFNITTEKDKAIVKLIIINPPTDLKESEFVTVKAY